jgi:hypothetical protein
MTLRDDHILILRDLHTQHIEVLIAIRNYYQHGSREWRKIDGLIGKYQERRMKDSVFLSAVLKKEKG